MSRIPAAGALLLALLCNPTVPTLRAQEIVRLLPIVSAQPGGGSLGPTTLSAPASTTALVAGGLLGGAAGVLAGGAAGIYVGGNRCADPGNPDSCRGLEGMLIGAFVGYTLGTPTGVHLANRRAGSYPISLLVSTGIAAAAGVTIAAHERGRSALTAAVVLGAPVTQLLASVLIERRTSR